MTAESSPGASSPCSGTAGGDGLADAGDVLADECAHVARKALTDDHVEFVPQHVVIRLDFEFVSSSPPSVGEDVRAPESAP